MIARAYATPTEICVEVPTSTGTPYTCRYPKTPEGLAQALNILITHPHSSTFHPEPHTIINSKLVPKQANTIQRGSPQSRTLAAELVRRLFK